MFLRSLSTTIIGTGFDGVCRVGLMEINRNGKTLHCKLEIGKHQRNMK